MTSVVSVGFRNLKGLLYHSTVSTVLVGQKVICFSPLFRYRFYKDSFCGEEKEINL